MRSPAGTALKVLIVEDDATSALFLERALAKDHYRTISCSDGAAALETLGKEPCDAVVSDWMMPRMDGIELTRKIRETIRPLPVVLIVTSLSSAQARSHALQSGADDYLAKPFSIPEILERLGNCLSRRQQPEPLPSAIQRAPLAPSVEPLPPFPVLCIAASTGGPGAVLEVVKNLGNAQGVAVLLVLHGPAWMLEAFSGRLQQETPLKVHLAEQGMQIEPGHIFVAPGDRHMTVEPSLRIRLNQDAPENFIRPAADPLFRSVARVFRRRSIALVLTGMGRDGTLGASQIVAAGGMVIAQDPRTATAPSMPETAVNAGITTCVVPLPQVAFEALRYLPSR